MANLRALVGCEAVEGVGRVEGRLVARAQGLEVGRGERADAQRRAPARAAHRLERLKLRCGSLVGLASGDRCKLPSDLGFSGGMDHQLAVVGALLDALVEGLVHGPHLLADELLLLLEHLDGLDGGRIGEGLRLEDRAREEDLRGDLPRRHAVVFGLDVERHAEVVDIVVEAHLHGVIRSGERQSAILCAQGGRAQNLWAFSARQHALRRRSARRGSVRPRPGRRRDGRWRGR